MQNGDFDRVETMAENSYSKESRPVIRIVFAQERDCQTIPGSRSVDLVGNHRLVKSRSSHRRSCGRTEPVAPVSALVIGDGTATMDALTCAAGSPRS